MIRKTQKKMRLLRANSIISLPCSLSVLEHARGRGGDANKNCSGWFYLKTSWFRAQVWSQWLQELPDYQGLSWSIEVGLSYPLKRELEKTTTCSRSHRELMAEQELRPWVHNSSSQDPSLWSSWFHIFLLRANVVCMGSPTPLVGEKGLGLLRGLNSMLSTRVYLLLFVLFLCLCMCDIHIRFQFILTLKSIDFKAWWPGFKLWLTYQLCGFLCHLTSCVSVSSFMKWE